MILLSVEVTLDAGANSIRTDSVYATNTMSVSDALMHIEGHFAALEAKYPARHYTLKLKAINAVGWTANGILKRFDVLIVEELSNLNL